MPSGWVSHRLGGSPKCISALSLPSGTVGAPSKPDNDATRGRTRPTVPPPDPAAMGTWKFFRASVDGRPVFKKEFDKLPDQARAALIVLMQRYLVGDLAAGSIKPIRGDILELRWHEANNHFRVLFFRWGPASRSADSVLQEPAEDSQDEDRDGPGPAENLEKSLRRHPTDLNNAQPLLRG